MTETEPAKNRKPGSGWLNLLIDYGPLLVFLVVYRQASPEDSTADSEIRAILYGTGAFMAAAVVALIASRTLLGKISPMLWFSTVLIVGFGALTIAFGDPTFVQLKPTIIYSVMGAALFIGWIRGVALLKILLEAAFDGLSAEGWLKLSRNWAVFFFFLAGLNEVLRALYNEANGTFETWLWAKFAVFMPLTFLFTFANIPMLLKHGLDVGQDEE
ncbi:MAG: inner membrane-spanning protein YciB [Pseudomonadota bacterium]